jgi:tetratricopeptide (TPR) repeat protein
MRKLILIGAALAVAAWAAAQATPNQQPTGPGPSQAPPRSEPQPAPRGPEDSSSRDSLPAPEAEAPDDSVTEMHPWDPHKALKDIEVGDFYFKRENYPAALSRYCEALTYKPNDAVATFRVAQSLEKSGDLAGAQPYYQAYLKIFPQGPLAAQSKKALERLKTQPERPNKHLAQQQGCEPVGKTAKIAPEPLDPERPVLTRTPASQSSEEPQ